MKKIRYLVTLIIFCFTFTFSFADGGVQKLEELKKKHLKVSLNSMSISELQVKKKEIEKNISSIGIAIDGLENHSPVYSQEIKKRVKELKEELEQLKNELKPIETQLDRKSSDLSKELNIINIYNFFTHFFKDMYKYIGKICKYLLKLFFLLELINILINKPSEIPINSIAKLIFKTAIIYFLIHSWQDFFSEKFLEEIEKIAHYITFYGDKMSSRSFTVTPDKVWGYYSSPIFSSFQADIVSNLINNILLVIGLVVVAFITIEYFMGIIEFYFMLAMGTFLLPFCIWQHTANIGGRIVGIIAYQFFKMLTMLMFIKVGFALIPDLTGVDLVSLTPGFLERAVKNFFGANISMEQTELGVISAYVLLLYVIKVLISKASGFANILVGGGSSLSASDATTPIGRVAAGVLSGVLITLKAGTLIKAGANIVKGKSIGKLASATKNQVVGEQKKDG